MRSVAKVSKLKLNQPPFVIDQGLKQAFVKSRRL